MNTLKELRVVEELCEKLDSELYLPVRQELKDVRASYSLGSRKEDFKILIDEKFKQLRQKLGIDNIKEIESPAYKCSCGWQGKFEEADYDYDACETTCPQCHHEIANDENWSEQRAKIEVLKEVFDVKGEELS